MILQIPKSLPIVELKRVMRDQLEWVWDPIRKKEILFTPEEHVRQCLLQFFLQEWKVPAGLISLERGLKYNRMQKRYDLLVYNRAAKPALLCECKAPQVALDENALKQLFTYNQKMNCEWVMLCNGTHFLCWKRNEIGDFDRMKECGKFWEETENNFKLI